MRVAFFDSGIGGITVLHEALKLLPDEDFLYYADIRNVPYGAKDKEVVRSFVMNAAAWMVERGVKAVVLACNTATSVAVEDLRALYKLPIIGMEPAVKPAVEYAAEIEKRALVLATPLTLKEEKFRNLLLRLDKENVVDFLPMPELVSMAERFVFSGAEVEMLLNDRFKGIDMEKYGTLVLGCTHFPFFKPVLRKILPGHIKIIDGNAGTVRHLKRTLYDNSISGGGSGGIEFYHSGTPVEKSDVKRYSEILSMLDRPDF